MQISSVMMETQKMEMVALIVVDYKVVVMVEQMQESNVMMEINQMEMDVINIVLLNQFVEMGLYNLVRIVMMVILLMVMVVVVLVQQKKDKFVKDHNVIQLKIIVEMVYLNHLFLMLQVKDVMMEINQMVMVVQVLAKLNLATIVIHLQENLYAHNVEIVLLIQDKVVMMVI